MCHALQAKKAASRSGSDGAVSGQSVSAAASSGSLGAGSTGATAAAAQATDPPAGDVSMPGLNVSAPGVLADHRCLETLSRRCHSIVRNVWVSPRCLCSNADRTPYTNTLTGVVCPAGGSQQLAALLAEQRKTNALLADGVALQREANALLQQLLNGGGIAGAGQAGLQ